jgi:hypothetical protein
MSTVNTLQIGQSPWQRIILLIVLGYEGAGALLGGALLVVSPDGRHMDMPVELLNGVFPDFLVPGVILIGLGILNTLGFVAVIRKQKNDWLMAGLSLGGLYVWFTVEIIILQELHWLHLMWGLPVLLGWIVLIPGIARSTDKVAAHKWLLLCGILSSAWYVAINALVPLFYDGYSVANLTVSELSAVGSPTRIMWVLLVTLYTLLLAAFGWGILISSQDIRSLRATGCIVLAYCIFNLYWPPMQMRGNEMAMTDRLHIGWGVVSATLMLIMIVSAARAFGRPFRIYSYVTLVLFAVFGALTGMQGGALAANRPTPMIGVWERISIAAFMIWVAVLAVSLLRSAKIGFADRTGHSRLS